MIQYFPNRIYRGKAPAIDRTMAIETPITISGSANLAAASMDVVVSNTPDVNHNQNWTVTSTNFSFDSATAKTFSATIMNGRKVVADMNDYLYIHVDTTPVQRITLTPGFYNGTQLAAHLKAILDANAVYVAAGITFTVTYTALTGLFVVTPSKSTIRYLDTFLPQNMGLRDSIAGSLFGFTSANTPVLAANITSSVAHTELNSEFAVISQSASTATSYVQTDPHHLTLDQAIHLTANTSGSVTAFYSVIYNNII